MFCRYNNDIIEKKGIYMKLVFLCFFYRVSGKILGNNSNAKAYSEPCQTSKEDNFCENS